MATSTGHPSRQCATPDTVWHACAAVDGCIIVIEEFPKRSKSIQVDDEVPDRWPQFRMFLPNKGGLEDMGSALL